MTSNGLKELDFSDPGRASAVLRGIQKRSPQRPIRIMNVCGSHERTVAQLGLRKALGGAIRIIPGPGCPVCVCPSEDLQAAVGLALGGKVRLALYGDLLRVPINAPHRGVSSLADCKERGAKIHIVASPLEARALAEAHPSEPVVFFSAGFETTTAPLAALILAGVPDNLSLLLSHKRTSPAVRVLLESGEAGFDALIAPGHVSAIVGSEDWRFVASDFHLPVAVCGFYDLSLLLGVRSLVDLVLAGSADLLNLYPQVVRPAGNPRALEWMSRVFEIDDARWRGVGTIPSSGYSLAPPYRHLDARQRFGLEAAVSAEEMPAGCACHHVVMGRQVPSDCPLFGSRCTPRSPVGPCMVSEEGACRIWHRYGGGY